MALSLKFIPRVAYMRYALLNTPGLIGFTLVLLLVDHWFDLPTWLFGVLIGCWLAKEIILFPFVWKAYDLSQQNADRVVGNHGIVTKRLAPSGYVRVSGELWRAEPTETGMPIEKGRRVLVLKMEGLTLYITPDHLQPNKPKTFFKVKDC